MKRSHTEEPKLLKCDVNVESEAQTGALGRILGSELLMDAISCIPVAAGLLAALLAPTELDGSLVTCLFACAVSVAVVTFLSRRWWLFPVALVALAAVWLLSALLTGGLGLGIMYWREFVNWFISGALYTENATAAGFTAIVYIMALFAVTSPAFVLLRRFFSFAVIVALLAGALILSAAFTAADLSAAVCLSVAGIILLLPRVYARHIEKLGGTASGEREHAGNSQFTIHNSQLGYHGFDSGRAERLGLSRARMQAVAIPAAVLALLFALVITPRDARNWRSNLLSAWAEDIGTLFTGRYSEPDMPGASFDLSSTGYQTETGRLGGPVTLSDELYLIVQAPRPVLLKGSVLDHYDGAGWSKSRPDGNLRFNSLLWRGERNETFDLDKPTGSAMAGRLYEQLTEEITISVIHDKAAYGTMFTAGRLSGVSMGSRLNRANAYFNRRSELFTRMYIPHNAEYTLRSRVWNMQLDGFAELFMQLEGQASDERRYADISERYTQLPEMLPGIVRETAAAITDGALSPYMKASAISRWLAENAEYTLEPENPPEGVDFTAHFLDSREGYCVYYATAMTVLSRCAGLPARYVQGFALANTPWSSNYQYRATGLTAHAWSEVYFEGIGWMPFDPLLWDTDSPLNEPAQGDGTHAAEPSPSPSPAPPETSPEQPPRQGGRDGPAGSILLVLLLFGLFALALYILYRFALRAGPGRVAREWTIEAVRRRYPDPPKQLDALYNDTLKLLLLQGLTVQPDETLVTFPARIDRIIAMDGAMLADIAGALMNSHFGNMPPSDEDILRACLYHSRLEALTLEALGARKYLFKRVLMFL